MTMRDKIFLGWQFKRDQLAQVINYEIIYSEGPPKRKIQLSSKEIINQL